MRLSMGGRAWAGASKGRERTQGGILIPLVAVGVLSAALSGCQAVTGLLPAELRGSRSAPEEALCLEYEVLPADGQAVTPRLLEQTRTIIENRVNATGVAEPIVTAQGADRISVELPGLPAEYIDEVRSLIGTTGVLEFLPVPAALQGSVGKGPLPDGMTDIEPLFSGSEVASASTMEDPTTHEIVVDLRLNDTGARLFDDYAKDHYGEQFAIVLDKQVMSAPIIQATRFGGRAQISGGLDGFSVDEAERLVVVLRFGSLPLEIREVGVGACPGIGVSPASMSLSPSSEPVGLGGRGELPS
jgi:protein-export membrane protein SecD